MQKVYKNCVDLDKRCYEKYHLNEEILQEHAAIGMERVIRNKFCIGSSVLIVAGKGNNGADGIALGRLLHLDYAVSIYLPFGTSSYMAKLQFQRAEALGIDIAVEIKQADIVVDALLGTGVVGELDNQILDLIENLNSINGYKIACDIPTGISMNGEVLENAFIADTTITMGAYKEALFLDEAKDFVGEIVRVDLGINNRLYEDNTNTFLLEKSDIRLPFRKKLSTHKGLFGHSAIFCGEKEGAGIMSGEASYRFGAGLTTLVMQDKVMIPPHLMHSYSLPHNTTAIAIGMGLGSYFEISFLDKYIASNALPLIIDADALYSPDLLQLLIKTPRKIVMTPHPKEFIYMWKALTNEEITLEYLQSHRFEYARKFSALYPDIVLLLKGANMIISSDNKLYINPLGCSNLSKGGSGDVLSGLIVALLAQGYTALDAALNGSLALSLSASRYNGANYAMTSTDLINNLAFLQE